MSNFNFTVNGRTLVPKLENNAKRMSTARKLSVLTKKALHTGQLCYLADLIDSYEPSRCLRSTNCHLLAVPSCVK